MNTRKFYIDGNWVDPIDGSALDVINPSTEQVCATISMGGEADVEAAVDFADLPLEDVVGCLAMGKSPSSGGSGQAAQPPHPSVLQFDEMVDPLGAGSDVETGERQEAQGFSGQPMGRVEERSTSLALQVPQGHWSHPARVDELGEGPAPEGSERFFHQETCDLRQMQQGVS